MPAASPEAAWWKSFTSARSASPSTVLATSLYAVDPPGLTSRNCWSDVSSSVSDGCSVAISCRPLMDISVRWMSRVTRFNVKLLKRAFSSRSMSSRDDGPDAFFLSLSASFQIRCKHSHDINQPDMAKSLQSTLLRQQLFY